MRPVSFMRLRQIDKPEDLINKYNKIDLSVEQKYDGFKIMASRGRGSVRLYSRNGNDLTSKATIIVNKLNNILEPNSTYIGEIIYVLNGMQNLGMLQSVLHSSANRANEVANRHSGHLEFIIYDIIEYDGKIISNRSFNYRRSLLNNIPKKGIVRISKLYTWSNRKKAMNDSIANGGEGIVIKLNTSPYIYRPYGEAEPFGLWWKYKVPGKKSHTEDVILSGYDRREKRLSFRMYQLNKNGRMLYVGNISNLPRETESTVKKLIDAGKAAVAEISHQERFKSGKFRHPGWIRLRYDKPLKSSTATSINKLGKRMSKKNNPSIEFTNAIDTHLGRNNGRKLNPRNSKVKDALASEATRFTKFEDFANAYWNTCARGLYWYPTDEKQFHIGEHERKLISSGRFIVSCSPDLALATSKVGYSKEDKKYAPKSKRYVAELDVTRVPESDIKVRRNANGTEIKIVGSAGSIKVSRVLDSAAANRSFMWQLSILPSSKEELIKVWEKAWEKRRKKAESASEKLAKEKDKEDKRSTAIKRREASAAIKSADRLKRKSESEASKARTKAKRAAYKEAEKERLSRPKNKPKNVDNEDSVTKVARPKTSAKKVAKSKIPKGAKWKRVSPNQNPSGNVRTVKSNKNRD